MPMGGTTVVFYPHEVVTIRFFAPLGSGIEIPDEPDK